jgi:deoxyribonuclease V
MHASLHHGWDLSRDDARRLQQTLAAEIVREDELPELRSLAGVTLGYPRAASGSIVGRAAVVVVRLPDLEILEQQVVIRAVTFPYIPGFRSFREAPLVIAALEALTARPDLLLVEGHGIAHPARFGVASHLGVVLDLPTMGCATSAPIGTALEPAPEVGSWTPLLDRNERIGAAVRTKAGSRPVYVSTGHRISLESALRIVLETTRTHRLPEPLRLASRLATAQRP